MVVIYQILKAMHHIYICIYIHIYIYMLVYLPVKVNTRMFLKQSTSYDVENAHPWWGSGPRSLDHIPSSINSRHVSDHRSNEFQICFSILGAPKQTKNVYRNYKDMNCRCLMTAILNLTISGETVPFTAWHTAEMDSAQKNAYRNNKWSTFPPKMPTGLYLGLYFNFLSWLFMLGLKLIHIKKRWSGAYSSPSIAVGGGWGLS